jgi:hypothetical protein
VNKRNIGIEVKYNTVYSILMTIKNDHTSHVAHEKR